MKKMIRDRSIFAVVASIAMAAIMLFYSTQPAPVRLPQEIQAMVGQEANLSFSRCFTALQNWYDAQTLTADGVELASEVQYEEMVHVVSTLEGFLNAFEKVDDQEDMLQLQEFFSPMMGFLLSYMSVMIEFGTTGSYVFSAEEWDALGSVIQSMTDYYRAL